jgi:hypothetical protein
MSFVPAKCPSCSAIIQVPADRERAVCMFCGTSLMTQAAISFLGGPNPKDTLAVALQLLTARDFMQAEEQLNRVLEYNPKSPDAWAAKAYRSLNPDISSVKSTEELCARILAAFKQGSLYLQNALEVPIFDEEIARLAPQSIMRFMFSLPRSCRLRSRARDRRWSRRRNQCQNTRRPF